MKPTQYLTFFLIVASCAVPTKSSTEAEAQDRITRLDPESQNNIRMLMEMIDEQGGVTPPGDQRYIPYEFRIPLDAGMRRQVHRIDPTIHFTKRTDTYQCIGENATKEKILRIVALPFTYKVKYCPYE